MLKKSVALFTVSCFIVSCNIFTNNNFTTGGSSLLNKYNKGGFNIKSTTNPNEIKKNFLPVTRIIKQKGKEREKDDNKKRVFTFNASKDDLKRSFILNITNGAGGGERVGNLEVFINGTQVIFNHDEDIDNTDDINKIKKKLCGDDTDDRDGKEREKDDDKKFKIKHDGHDKNKPSCELLISNFFNKKTDALSVGLPSIKEGVNSLEVRVKDERDKFVLDISIDGFLKAFNLPKSVHSIVPLDESSKKMPYEKGFLNLKFTEGLKTRLIGNDIIDLNGTNLTSLKNIFKSYNIQEIIKPFPLDSDELDQKEIKAEHKFNRDIPNMNLFFTLKFSDNIDIWKMRSEIKKLPFIEEVIPIFKYNQPLSDYSSNDPFLVGDNFDAHWLQTTRVANKGTLKGAWDILDKISTATGKDIRYGNLDSFPENTRDDNKIATIGAGIYNKILTNKVSHEDLDNPKITIYSNDNSTDIGFTASHDTQVLGIMSATVNNEKGLVGISNKAKLDFYRVSDSYCRNNLSNKDSIKRNNKCDPLSEHEILSNLDFKLGPTVIPKMAPFFSFFLAKKNKAKVILIEIAGASKTVEQLDPFIRAIIPYFVSEGSTVIVPASNAFDNNIRNLDVNCNDIINSDLCNGNTGQQILPMVDTGSIIVGGLNSSGKNLYYPQNSQLFDKAGNPILDNNNNPKFGAIYYNYGKTDFGNNESDYDYSPISGHGIDISGPSENILTTSYGVKGAGSSNNNTYSPQDYVTVDGTSFTSPMISSIVSLAYTIAPDIDPLTIRDLIRITANDSFTGVTSNSRTTAGCVNAYEFLKRVLKLANDKDFIQINGKSIFEDRFGKPFSISSVEEPPQPISEQIKEELSKIQITLNGKNYTLLEIVQNYADFTLDPAFFQNNTLTEDVRIKIQNTLNTITGNTFSFLI
ncbi:MAG: S8 family serine peptidase [Candidatus Sericytochromatia bacterium]